MIFIVYIKISIIIYNVNILCSFKKKKKKKLIIYF